MAGNISPKDMEIISDGVLDGLGTIDQLPDGVKNSLFQYWSSQGIDATQPGAQITDEQLAQLKQQREQAKGGFFNSPIFKPIEWVGSKLYQVYSSTVSPAASFAALELGTAVNTFTGGEDYLKNEGLGFGDAWDLAHHVSPGQAWWMIGMTPDEKKAAGMTPRQLEEEVKAVRAGTYKGKPTASDPLGLQTTTERYFGNGPAKWATGAVDFGLSWYADPLVLGGKAAGAAKATKFTRSVTPQIQAQEANILKSGAQLSPEEANKLAFDSFSQKSYFQDLTSQIMKIKTGNPDTAAAVLARDLPTLRKSANGAPAARLLSLARDENEVANVLRVTLGDKAALSTLEFKNSELAYQADQLGQKTSAASTYYDSLSPAVQASPRGQKIKAAIDAQTKWISKLDQDSQIVTDKVNAFNTIGNLNFNSVTTPIGMRVKGALQNRSWQPTAGESFIGARVNNIYNASLGGVVRLAHTYNDIRATHYIDINDKESWRQVDASLRETPGLSKEGREMYVSKYLNARPEERTLALQNIETHVTRNIVDRYNLENNLTGRDALSYGVADSLYKELSLRRSRGQTAMKQQTYGGAKIENPNLPGTQIRVSEVEGDGGKLVLSPVLTSQLANSHVMLDFELFEKAIKTHGSDWQKAKNVIGTGWEKAVDLADAAGSIWKFAQLFRLGYAPRAMADDALGQVARYGLFSTLDRMVKGGKYKAQDIANATFLRGRVDNAQFAMERATQDLEDHASLQASLKHELDRAKITGDTAKVQQVQQDLDLSMQWAAETREELADMDNLVKGGQSMKHVQVGRQIFTPAFGGKEGGLFRDLSAGNHNFQNLMGSQADFYLDRMRRMDWENITPAQHGAEKHMNAWLRVINQQVANDALAVQYLGGKTPKQLESWLVATPEGRAYAAVAPLKNLSRNDMVRRVTAQVDEWLDPAFPNSGAFREAARTGTVTEEMLKEVPEAVRPMVNAQALGYARGNHPVASLMDRSMTGYYNIMNQIPARKLLRHPLFAQRYKVHLQDAYTKMSLKGETHIEEGFRQKLEHSARLQALDDVKKNTFNMDFESKMAYNLRNFGAFFGAQQESWNRWGRIISDKPDILPRVAQVYGAPARSGMVVDPEGHQVDADGYVTDPITGEKRLVDYSDRNILFQVPDYLGGKALNRALGIDEDAKLRIPMSTAEIILNHGDGVLPVGAGPIVQMAANKLPYTDLDANGDPKLADIYQKLGILPMGPDESNWHLLQPNIIKRQEATDEMNDTYQKSLFYIMQAETYKYDQHMRKTQPTWDEIKDRASRWTAMRSVFAGVLPFSLNAQDPYQFFRDQYKQMQQLDYKNADQLFHDKYGDSAYIFSQSQSKNNSGLKPTVESVKASKYYQDLIAKTGPEWAGLVVGAEGEGVYSQGAFYYEKTHSADGVSGIASRTNLSAREAYDESMKSKGWSQYKSYMNGLYAELFNRGLTSFDDDGAEDLKAEKKSLVDTLTQPRILDENGDMQDNPYYNKQWAEAYQTLDVGYYDRATAQMKTLVNDPEIWSKAQNPDGSVGMRSDIYTLKTYLQYRDDAKRALIMRDSAGGSADINAAVNADIKQQWNAMVAQLIESDTKFGDLFSRYLSRDMGYDQETVQQQEQAGTLGEFQGDTSQAQEQSIFDVLAQGGYQQ